MVGTVSKRRLLHLALAIIAKILVGNEEAERTPKRSGCKTAGNESRFL
jgi:hypothetical protein